MLSLIIKMLQAQQQQQTGRAAMQREALTPVHRGMSGGIIDPTTGKEAGNPFDNGFFLGGNARAQRETDVLGGNRLGQTGLQLQGGMASPLPPAQPPAPTFDMQTVGDPINQQRKLTGAYGTGSSKLMRPKKSGAQFAFM